MASHMGHHSVSWSQHDRREIELTLRDVPERKHALFAKILSPPFHIAVNEDGEAQLDLLARRDAIERLAELTAFACQERWLRRDRVLVEEFQHRPEDVRSLLLPLVYDTRSGEGAC